ILGVEDTLPVAQSRDHGAAGLLAEHVAIGQAPLASRLLDDLRQPARDRAEEAVTGIDDLARGGLLTLLILRRGHGRRRLISRWRRVRRRRGRIVPRWRIGLSRQRSAAQADQ